MQPTLLLFVHPALEKSRVNRLMLERAKATDGIRLNDLYEAYPDHHVNMQAEQRLLEEHNSIIIQFPFYWYSSPSLLKEWFDIVLSYGWAYGKTGTALLDKKVRLAVTTGGSESSYTAEGYNGHSMEELLAPMIQTFKLCGMQYTPGSSFFMHKALHLEDNELTMELDRYQNWLKED